MKNLKIALVLLVASTITKAQKVAFTEYDLKNGLHVVLHKDNSAPVVAVSVMYHVGSKNETPNRTGFAHFFEHLLFEGSENIKRGEFMKIVSSNGGQNNANTTQYRTFYYEVFPSNQLETGLWLESERMLHPVINEIGVKTQNEVVKEEKRLRYDNSPYGQLIPQVKKHMFTKHPYRWTTIGSMDHLDAAKLEEFQAFNKKFYIPNNAVLIVAGDISNPTQTKEWVQKYFGSIPKGPAIERQTFVEDPITQPINATFEDANIQKPMVVSAYRTPSMKTRDARVLDFISTYLSDGKSSKLYKKIVDDKKMALQIGAFSYNQEDYGTYILYGMPQGEFTSKDIIKEVDEEIVKLQTDLISENDLQKLKNKYENNYVSGNASVEGIADNLSSFYLLYGDVNLINTEIEMYNSITREEIREIAKKYLNPNQRLLLDYIPAKDKAESSPSESAKQNK